MACPEERIKNYYAEESGGVPKNCRMNGIPVKYKNKKSIVYFYIEGAKILQFSPRFENNIRRIFDERVLHSELMHCDYAATSIEKDKRHEIVEWSTSVRLRSAILQYGKVKRAMKIKTIKNLLTKYAFHVLLEET